MPVLPNDLSEEARATYNSKPWHCGDPYLHSPDQGLESEAATKQDHWNTVLEYISTKEKDRCNVWKDEVQNLLVFSGLFSAVVTALLVESYRDLEEDPNHALFRTMAVGIARLANMTEVGELPQAFAVSASTKRINALWFLSLVFSLSTAVISIVSLQWLREHLRAPSEDVAPSILPSLLHMQSEALDRFYVPQIFNILPLLLLVGLVLFLVGMVDFLWSLNHLVALPASFAIIFIFIFLIITTVLPGLQPLPLRNLSCKIPIPQSPCPYKSPQSQAFLRARVFAQSAGLSASQKLHYLLDSHILRFFRRLIHPSFLQPLDRSAFGLRGNWGRFAMMWLHQRDFNQSDITAEFWTGRNYSDLRGRKLIPLFDCVKLLLKVKQGFLITGNHKLGDVYRCFDDILHQAGDYSERYLYSLLPSSSTLTITENTLESMNPPAAVTMDSARLLFMLHGCDPTSTKFPVSLHHLEACVRLTGWMIDGLVLPLDHPLAFPITLMPKETIQSTPGPFRKIMAVQLLHLLKQFMEEAFSQWSQKEYLDEDIRVTVGTTSSVTNFLQIVAQHAAAQHDAVKEYRDEILNLIEARFGDHAKGYRLEYLYVVSTLYTHWTVVRSRKFGHKPTPALVNLVYTLRSFKLYRCDIPLAQAFRRLLSPSFPLQHDLDDDLEPPETRDLFDLPQAISRKSSDLLEHDHYEDVSEKSDIVAIIADPPESLNAPRRSEDLAGHFTDFDLSSLRGGFRDSVIEVTDAEGFPNRDEDHDIEGAFFDRFAKDFEATFGHASNVD